MSSSSSLNTLPHTTLLRILQNVGESSDLYHLALQSRRLNQLAMPLYLSRLGIPIRNFSQAAFVHVSLPEQHHILAAFRLSFFINSIQGLSCIITSRPADTYGYTFERDLEALVMLLQTHRLRIRRITIHSKIDPSINSRTTTYDVDSRLCKAAFDPRAACTEMELGDDNGDRRVYSRGWDYVSPSYREMLIDNTCTKWKRIVSRSNFYVSSYTFRSHRQLLPSRLPGTLSLLRNTYSLDLSSVDLWGSAWSELLANIATTVRFSLQFLRINPTGIFPSDLLTFLSHLPSLVALTIDPPNADSQQYYHPIYPHHHQQRIRQRDRLCQNNTPLQDSYDPLKHPLRPLFPKLVIISTPLNLLPFLLSGSTPKLQSITINIHRASTLFSPASEKLFAQTATLLERRTALLPKRKRSGPTGIPHLTLNVTFDLPEIWCMSVNLNDFFRLGIGGTPIEGKAGPAAAGSERFFKMVESLAVISRSPYPFPGDEMSTSVLCQWLRRFPGVKYLAIEDMHGSFPPIYQDQQQFFLRYNRNGPRDHRKYHYYSSFSVYSILHALRMQCPNVSTVILDKCYEVSDVLEEREGAVDGRSSFARYRPIRADDTGSNRVENEKKQKYRGLGDLNEDIFYLIFQYLETKELYPLSRVSRNLLCWVLPVYLLRRTRSSNSSSLSPSSSASSMSSFTSSGGDANTIVTLTAPPIIDICLFIDAMDPLLDISALTLSPSVHTIPHLSCSLSSGVSLFRAYEFLKRLLRLLKKLRAVGKMRLDFGGMVFSSTMTTESATRGAKRVWTKLVMELFEEVRNKAGVFVVAGCGYFQSLTGSWGEINDDSVQEGGGERRSVDDEQKLERGQDRDQDQKSKPKRRSIISLPALSTSNIKFLSRSQLRKHYLPLCAAASARTSPTPSTLLSSPLPSPDLTLAPVASPPLPPCSTTTSQQHLTKLKIESDALLLPIFRDWARSTLRISPFLTKLRVTKLTYLTVSFLRALLDVGEGENRHMTNVKDLKLSGDTVMMEDILGVIGCLKGLEKLEIVGCCLPGRFGGVGGYGSSGIKLEHLKRLSAPAEYVVQFLKDAEQDMVGKELEELAVRILHRRDPDGMLGALRGIAPIVSWLTRLREGKIAGAGSTNKGEIGDEVGAESTIHHHTTSKRDKPSLFLSLDMYLQPTCMTQASQGNNMRTTKDWEAVANLTSELTFRFDDRSDDSPIASAAAWLPEHIAFEVHNAIAVATTPNTLNPDFIPGFALNNAAPPGGNSSTTTPTYANNSHGPGADLRRWLELFPCVRKLTLVDAPKTLPTKAVSEWMDLGNGEVCPCLETVVINGQLVDLVKKGKGKRKEREHRG